MIFKLKCIHCGIVFEQAVVGEAAEVFLDAFEAGGKEIMQGCCPECMNSNRIRQLTNWKGLPSGKRV